MFSYEYLRKFFYINCGFLYFCFLKFENLMYLFDFFPNC